MQRRQHARVIGAGVLADQNDDLGFLEIIDLDGAFADADRRCQCRPAGFVAHVRAIRHVVGAELANEKLIEKRRLVARTAGGVKNRFIRRTERIQFSGDEFEGIVP